MSNYFRITGYVKEKDLCFIMDCNGMFEKLWEFSALMIQHKIQVIEVANDIKFLDGNINKVEYDANHIALRATAKGLPEYTTYEIDRTTYKAIKVADKIYVPDRNYVL
ncbi:MAG TPA: hypothetical protein PKV66_00305 [Candidatus Pelethenecus sp.]|nr:hypothetical protein [Candidatus Pelethenecus sp.]